MFCINVQVDSVHSYNHIENKLDTCQNSGITQRSFRNLRGSFVSVWMSCGPVSHDLDVDCDTTAISCNLLESCSRCLGLSLGSSTKLEITTLAQY